MSEVKKLTRTNWRNSFSVTGKPRLTDTTFKIDAQSQKSSWIYNSMGFSVDCGEKHGNVWVELLGGYSPDNTYPIYAHGKDENGRDDFSKKIEVDWDDRDNDDILDQIGDMCFLTIGIERTSEGKVYRKKFLHAYDAIKYVKDHLNKDMMVNVGGNLEYSLYNGRVQVRKTINRIVLIENQEEAVPSARFTQTVLLDKDSASLKNADKDKGVIYVDTRVLDYAKEINGVEIKGYYPYNVQFEFPMDFSNQEQCKKIIDKVFKVKKGITQITFEGEFVESGAAVQPTEDDLPDDIRELVDLGLWTMEDALKKCATNGSRERRMLLIKPTFAMVGDDDNKTPVLQKFEEQYQEEDLIFEGVPTEEETPWEEDDDTGSGNDDMSWLDSL